jgi:solute carrier family 20 (sodium-dependent phosphate transporter)
VPAGHHTLACLPYIPTSEFLAVSLIMALDFLAGAFSAVWLTYSNGLTSCDLSETPSWLMLAGGLFVCLGVYFLGHRVIQTVGFGLADINFLRGFCIEFASTTAVVLATFLGMPVSTTHCQVGAVIFVGWTAFGRRHVKWGMFGWIGLTWVVTLPFSAGLAAVLLAVSRPAVLS